MHSLLFIFRLERLALMNSFCSHLIIACDCLPRPCLLIYLTILYSFLPILHSQEPIFIIYRCCNCCCLQFDDEEPFSWGSGCRKFVPFWFGQSKYCRQDASRFPYIHHMSIQSQCIIIAHANMRLSRKHCSRPPMPHSYRDYHTTTSAALWNLPSYATRHYPQCNKEASTIRS